MFVLGQIELEHPVLSNKILLTYFNLSQPIHKVHFNVRYPVQFSSPYNLFVGSKQTWLFWPTVPVVFNLFCLNNFTLIKLSLLFSGRFICDIDLFCFGEGSIVIFGFAEAVEDEEGRA